MRMETKQLLDTHKFLFNNMGASPGDSTQSNLSKSKLHILLITAITVVVVSVGGGIDVVTAVMVVVIVPNSPTTTGLEL